MEVDLEVGLEDELGLKTDLMNLTLVRTISSGALEMMLGRCEFEDYHHQHLWFIWRPWRSH